MRKARPIRNKLYADDKLAGLYFATYRRSCRFRAECELEFNYPLDAKKDYALIDPQTKECIGVVMGSSNVVVFPLVLPQPELVPFRVYFLRPVLEDHSFDHLSEDERQRLIAAHIRRLLG